jgi:hypothetical protein
VSCGKSRVSPEIGVISGVNRILAPHTLAVYANLSFRALHAKNRRRCEAKERSQARASRRWARWHQLVHYGIGISGVVAGALAGVSGIANTHPTLVAAAAFVAAAAAGLVTVLNEKKAIKGHWNRNAGLEQLAQKYENLSLGEREPTRADLDALAEERKKLDEPWDD